MEQENKEIEVIEENITEKTKTKKGLIVASSILFGINIILFIYSIGLFISIETLLRQGSSTDGSGSSAALGLVILIPFYIIIIIGSSLLTISNIIVDIKLIKKKNSLIQTKFGLVYLIISSVLLLTNIITFLILFIVK